MGSDVYRRLSGHLVKFLMHLAILTHQMWVLRLVAARVIEFDPVDLSFSERNKSVSNAMSVRIENTNRSYGFQYYLET